MTQLDSPLTDKISIAPHTATRLRGRGLWLWRTISLIFIGVLLGLYVTTLPSRYVQLESLVYVGRDSVEQLGLSARFYALYNLFFEVALAMSCAAIAGLIYWRRSDDWLAMLVAIALLLFGAQVNGFPLDAPPANRDDLGWLLDLTVGLNAIVSIAVFYVLPDGRFVPRWTRFLIVGWALWAVTWVVFPSSPVNYIRWGADRSTIAWGYAAESIWYGTGSLAQIYRFRRISTPEQRQQTKWIVLGTGAALSVYIASSLPFTVLPILKQPGVVLLIALLIHKPLLVSGLLLVPISFAVSILRYRLWDIDFIINRALVYGGLIALLGVVFIGGFLGLREMLESMLGAGQGLFTIGIPAVAATALFNPARNSLRRLVDKRVYHIGLDYHAALKEYGERQRAQPTSDDRIITLIGSYRRLTLLGKGGMGEVYRAQDPALNTSVAIKILPAYSAHAADAKMRFMREAQTVARLKHPNIVTLHDVGEQDGQPYMVMEYIDGLDLSDMLRQRGHLPLGEALPILSDVAAALDYAHAQGVIHRDIKPSNVMVETIPSPTLPLQGEGARRAVLMDFGIAKSYAAATRLTHSGGMIGTLDYISPEQIQGAAEVDARADIYSFGVMAYQVLTGKLPFEHNNPGAMVLAHLYQPPPDPREAVNDVPDSAALAVIRAMSKKPDQRFDTAGEFIATMA